VHPDDAEMLYRAEMMAFKQYDSICTTYRNSFSLIMTLRMRNHVGGYCRVLRRISSFMPGRNDAIWLVMISVEMLETTAERNDGAPKLYNAQNGLIYDLTKEGSLREYRLGLSAVELKVLKLRGMGYSSKEVAAKLFLSEHTIATHRRNICDQFQSNDIKAIYKIVKALGGFVKRE
jgi:DNA-binding CsgD family transcriptional regulator